MIKRNITLEEAERRFPSSTIEWEVVGGNAWTESYQAAARLGAPLVRWNVLRDVLCLGWFDPFKPCGSYKDAKVVPGHFHEVAFWTVDLKGYPLTAIGGGGWCTSRFHSPPTPSQGRWVFNDPILVWAFDRNWIAHPSSL